MTDSPVPQPLACERHGLPYGPAGPGHLACGAGCVLDAPLPFPSSPLSDLEIGACQRHEVVLAHEKAGFSRTEAMQIMCCMITATIMKGSGSG